MRYSIAFAIVLATTATGCPHSCPDGFLMDQDGNCLEDGGGNDSRNNPGHHTDTGTDPGPAPEPQTGTIYIWNDSSYDIDEIYVADCSSSTWGPNLESGILWAGDSAMVTGVPAGCYDLSAVSIGGYYWETYGVNLTDRVDWSLGD